MRISGLAQAGGVPVATIKFYLREGLLPAGEATGATQARYDDGHLARLRLIRALVDVAGLSLAQVKAVLSRLDDPPQAWHDVLGIAHGVAVTAHPASSRAAQPDDPRKPDDTAPARALVAQLGWDVNPRTPALGRLQRAVEALSDAGLDLTPDRLAVYAAAAHRIAEHDVDGVPRTSPAEAARHVVLGTLLYEPLLLALRQLAHEDVSAARFGTLPRPGDGATGAQAASGSQPAGTSSGATGR